MAFPLFTLVELSDWIMCEGLGATLGFFVFSVLASMSSLGTEKCDHLNPIICHKKDEFF